MTILQPVRGTHDLLPEEARRHRFVAETARNLSELYGFGEMATPIFEFTEVFKRTIGETTDIVMKEMYTFTDNGGDSLTLRPEGTAGVARAVITGGLAQQVPLKFFYHGPMFRYERPQKGRLRQFHQFGVELLGAAEPLADVEVIALGAHILDALGVFRHCTLELNSLGDEETRSNYRSALIEYLRGHIESLSEDSRRRLERNPLRVLDSKDPSDREVVAGAPVMTDFLTPASAEFFDGVRRGLDAVGVPYTLNPRLVRGLDYYCHTTFEFTTSALGSQGTVMAGGRYDQLVSMMGGPPTPGIGWAAGVERLAMLVETAPPAPRPVALVPVGPEAETAALRLAQDLRKAGVSVEMTYRGNVGKRMKRANKVNARAAILLGDELARNAATVKDLDSGEQVEVPLTSLKDHLARLG